MAPDPPPLAQREPDERRAGEGPAQRRAQVVAFAAALQQCEQLTPDRAPGKQGEQRRQRAGPGEFHQTLPLAAGAEPEQAAGHRSADQRRGPHRCRDQPCREQRNRSRGERDQRVDAQFPVARNPAQPRGDRGQQRETECDQRQQRLDVLLGKVPLAQRDREQREAGKLADIDQPRAVAPDMRQRNRGEDSGQPAEHDGEFARWRRKPACRQYKPDRARDRAGFAHARLAPAEESQRRADQQVERPGQQRMPRLGDHPGQLQRRDGGGADAQPERAVCARAEGGQDNAEQDQIAAKRDDIGIARHTRQEQQNAPAEPAAERGERQPAAILLASGEGQPGGHQREIEREQRHVRLVAADQQRRGETADQAEHRRWHAEAERQADRRRGDTGESEKRERRSDQAVMAAGEIEAGIERREAGSSQRLTHAFVGDEPLEAIGQLGPGDEREAEGETERDAHRRGQQPGLDRIAHEEKAGDGERDPAGPDRQQASEDLLEIEPGAIGFRSGVVRLCFRGGSGLRPALAVGAGGCTRSGLRCNALRRDRLALRFGIRRFVRLLRGRGPERHRGRRRAGCGRLGRDRGRVGLRLPALPSPEFGFEPVDPLPEKGDRASEHDKQHQFHRQSPAIREPG